MKTSLACLRVLALAAAVLSYAPAAAEPAIVAPQSVPIGGLCIVRVEGLAADAKFSWIAIPQVQTADLQERDGSPVLFIASDKAGTYHVVLAYLDGGEVHQKTAQVVIGGPAPTPVPPGPVPPLPVPPGPTPTPSGSRVVWIVYESTQTTPALGQLLTQMRQPPSAAYLQQQGHVLVQIDDDVVNESGQPPKLVADLRQHWEGLSLPVLLIADKATNQLVYKQALPPSATAASVLEIVKAND